MFGRPGTTAWPGDPRRTCAWAAADSMRAANSCAPAPGLSAPAPGAAANSGGATLCELPASSGHTPTGLGVWPVREAADLRVGSRRSGDLTAAPPFKACCDARRGINVPPLRLCRGVKGHLYVFFWPRRGINVPPLRLCRGVKGHLYVFLANLTRLGLHNNRPGVGRLR